MPGCFEWLNADADPQPGDPVYEVLHRFRSVDDEQQRLLLWYIKKETRIRREADARNKIDTMPYRPIVHDDFDARAQFDYLLKTWKMHRARASPVIEFRASKRFFPHFVDLRARDRWFVKVEVTEESLEALTPKEVRDTIKADHEFLHQLDSSRADYLESKMVEDEVVTAAQDPRFTRALMVNTTAQAQVQVPKGRAPPPPQPRGPPPPRGTPPPPRQHMQQQTTGGHHNFQASASTIPTIAPLPLLHSHMPFQNIGGNPTVQTSASTTPMIASQPHPSLIQAQTPSLDLPLQDSASTTPFLTAQPLPSYMQAQATSVDPAPQISASTTPMPLPTAYMPLLAASGEATLQGSASTTPLLATRALPPQYMQLHTTGYGPGFQGNILAAPMGPPPVPPRPQQYLHPLQPLNPLQSLYPQQPLYSKQPQQSLNPLQGSPLPPQFPQPISSLTMNANTSALLHHRTLKAVSTDDNWWRHELLQIMDFHRTNSPTALLQFDLPLMNQHIVKLQRDVQREKQRCFVRILYQKALDDQQRQQEQEAAARQQQETLLQLEVERLLREQERQQQEAMAVQLQQALQPLFDQQQQQHQQQQTPQPLFNQQQQEAIGLEIQRMVKTQEADLRQQQHQQSLQFLADNIQQQTADEEVQQVEQQQQQLEQGVEHQQLKLEQRPQSAEQQQQQQMLESLQKQAGQRPQQQ